MKIQNINNNKQNSRQNFGWVSFNNLDTAFPRIVILKDFPSLVSAKLVQNIIPRPEFDSKAAEKLSDSNFTKSITKAAHNAGYDFIRNQSERIQRVPKLLEKMKKLLKTLIEEARQKGTLTESESQKMTKIVDDAQEETICPIGFEPFDGYVLNDEGTINEFQRYSKPAINNK